MATRAERRAALQGRVPEPLPQPAHLTARLVDVEPGVITMPRFERSEDPEDQPMKTKHVSILLHSELDRMNGGKGQWSATSAAHQASETCTIEFNHAAQVVRISNGTACTYVPMNDVKRLGPTLEDATAHAETIELVKAEARRANEKAIAETAETAAQPAT